MLAGDETTLYAGIVKINQIKANKLTFTFTQDSKAL